jgi:hypothetical protein
MLMKNAFCYVNIVSKVRKGLQNRYFPESGKFDSAKNRIRSLFQRWQVKGIIQTLSILFTDPN